MMQTSADSPSATRLRRLVDRYGVVALVATALACALIAASAAAMLASGFRGMGDFGTIAVRALDVGTKNTPLLGTRSSVAPDASIGIMHHPGPIQFYVLAPWVRLLGDRGLPVAGAVINAAWILVLIWAAARTWGREGATAASFAALVLVGSLGVSDASSVWPPVAIIVPLAVTLVAAWAAMREIPGSWWLLVVAGTFVAQSNLPAAPTVVIAVLAAAAAAIIHRTSPRQVIGPALLGLVLWAPPIIEQFTDAHPNFRAILHSTGAESTIGASRSAQTVGVLVSSPFGWAGGAYARPWVPDARFPFETAHSRTSAVALIAGALVVVASIALAARSGWRRTALGVSACTALVAAAVAIFSRGPFVDRFVSNGWMRWMWAIAMVVWIASVAAGLRATSGKGRTFATALFAAFCLIPLPTIVSDTRRELQISQRAASGLESMERAIATAASQERSRTILIDCEYRLSGSLPTLVSNLEQDGVTVYIDFSDLGERRANFALFGDERNMDFPAGRSRDSVGVLTIRLIGDPAKSYATPGDRVIASTVMNATDAAQLDRLNGAKSLTQADLRTRDDLRDRVKGAKVVPQLVMFRPSTAEG